MPAWIDRRPTDVELERYRLILSLVNGHVGFARQWRDNIPYPDFQLMEEAFAAAFGGISVRGKDVFDVLVQNSANQNELFGIQLKTKEGGGPGSSKATTRRTGVLEPASRLYVEMANPAKATLRASGTTLTELQNHTANPINAGTGIMNMFQQMHNNSANNHKGMEQNQTINISRSITVLMTWIIYDGRYRYWLHSFPHELPDIPIWVYTDGGDSKSIRGFVDLDQQRTGRQAIDWSFQSGGQVKWYPIANDAVSSFGPYDLEDVRGLVSLSDSAVTAFPEHWP